MEFRIANLGFRKHEKLALSLQELPFIDFAFLFGSSSDGIIKANSDVDVAVYFSNACAANFDSKTLRRFIVIPFFSVAFAQWIFYAVPELFF